MKIQKKAISSPIFKLVDTFNIDIFMEDEYNFKLELFQALEDEQCFRCFVWYCEVIITKAIFREECVDCWKTVLSDFSENLQENYSEFHADSIESAMLLIQKDIQFFLKKYELNQNNIDS